MALVNINHLIGSLQSNFSGLNLVNLLSKQSETKLDLNNLVNVAIKDECQKEWLTGLLANLDGDIRIRNQYWKYTLECSSVYLDGIVNLAKDDRSLAEFAVRTIPDKELSWLWLASIIVETEPESAIALYKKALEIRPENGLTWYRLGEAYETAGQKYDAIDAFVTSTKYLNRGSNGYVRAGKIIEDLGDIPLAIYYYRLSINEGALLRADILESQLGDN
jgi:tetratricopeptide (TPR) repeat protein